MRILGRLAERHFVAILAGLERLDAGAAELRQLEETLEALESEADAGSRSACGRLAVAPPNISPDSCREVLSAREGLVPKVTVETLRGCGFVP